jgi:glycosidase
MKLKVFLAVFCLAYLMVFPSFSQKNGTKLSIKKFEPENWWVGMKNTKLQILAYGENIGSCEVSIVGKKNKKNYEEAPKNLSIKTIEKVENPNYLFIYLDLSKAEACEFNFVFKRGKEVFYQPYSLKKRLKSAEEYKGFDESDAVYLIMPDRFANGNPNNDSVEGLFQKLDRKEPFGRHGGDLQGITKNLDYVKSLGMTAIWLNPFVENNEKKESYHGYAITDYYKTDARYGTNQDFATLVNTAHQKDLKIIIDVVLGHCGDQHWFYKDLPEKNWIHTFPNMKPDSTFRSNYKLSVPSDPYASEFDKIKMVQGWFDAHMPDLDHRNPRLAQYAIQNAIWWIENFQIDGIRTDTHPYPHKDFTAKWCKAVMDEYPNFNIVGEVWDRRVITSAYWQKDAMNRDGYNSNLPCITDFPIYFALIESLNEEDNDWDWGMAKLYYVLTQDHYYSNPSKNMLFLDNHDVSRMAASYNKDIKKQKMALNLLATLRGMPQFFYGAEILMDANASNHGTLRSDFPGGWEGDAINAFTQKGLSTEQIEFQNYVKKLFNWRKTSKVTHKGTFRHFTPESGIYVFFKFNENETLMVITNNNNKDTKTINTTRYKEYMKGFSKAYNPITNQTIDNLDKIEIPNKTVMILELKK